MRMARRFIILIVLVGAVGYGVYYFGMDFVSNKAADTIDNKLNNETTLSTIKDKVQSLPEVQTYLEEGAKAKKQELPFTTKEEATKVIIKKVGPVKLKEMYSEYQNGMSETDIQAAVAELESDLSEEEMLALKAIAYDELNPS